MKKWKLKLTNMELITDPLSEKEKEGVDEAIPIHIRKERKSKAYKETMSQDIKPLTLMRIGKKLNITQWRPIYEVIDEAYIKESNIFPDDFIR